MPLGDSEIKGTAFSPSRRLRAALGGERVFLSERKNQHEKILHCLRLKPQCRADALSLPRRKIVGTSVIPDYQLLFKGSKTGSYLTIEKKRGGSVPVAVWAVSPRDELALDRYEGCPNFYYKTDMQLTVGKKKLDAFVYIMHEERKLGIPSHAYVRTCVQGYRDFGFDLKHLRLAFDISERGVRIENG